MEDISIHMIKSHFIHFKQIERGLGNLLCDNPVIAHLRKIPDSFQDTVCKPRRTTASARELHCTLIFDLNMQDLGRMQNDQFQFLRRIKLKPVDHAKPVSQRSRQKSCPCRSSYQRKLWQFQPDRTRSRSLSNHNIDRKIFHGRIEHFLYLTVQAVYFINKKQVSFLKIV